MTFQNTIYKDMYFEEAFVMEKVCIDRRAVELAHYIITTKDTVRGAAKKFGISKSTVHMEVTLRNGYELESAENHTHETVSAGADYSLSVQSSVIHIPESIAIKKVFLAEKNPIVKLELIVK